MPRVVGGFEVGRFTPENVLRGNGLDTRATVDQLVAASAAHDATNPGYLSEAELQKGAANLLVSLAGAPTTTTTDSFDYSRSVLSSVKSSMLTGNPNRTFTDAELVGAAAQWDDGNGYLKKSELEAGAMELQITSTGAQLKSSDIAAIRSWTGATRRDSTPPPAGGIGVISDIDKTLMQPTVRGAGESPPYPGVPAFLRMLESGASGTGASGDVTFVTARDAGRTTAIPAWLVANNMPAANIENGVAFPWRAAEDEKVADIERVFRAHPNQQFVLIGDCTHVNPEVYKRVRDKFPSQVKAVLIHDTKAIRADRLVGHNLVANYAVAAAVMFKKGVFDEASARSVMTAAKNDGLAITNAEIDALITSHRP